MLGAKNSTDRWSDSDSRAMPTDKGGGGEVWMGPYQKVQGRRKEEGNHPRGGIRTLQEIRRAKVSRRRRARKPNATGNEYEMEPKQTNGRRMQKGREAGRGGVQ